MKVKVKKVKNKNHHPKYSYNTGIWTTDEKPVLGIDLKWSLYEIKHGRLPEIPRDLNVSKR